MNLLMTYVVLHSLNNDSNPLPCDKIRCWDVNLKSHCATCILSSENIDLLDHITNAIPCKEVSDGD